MGKDILDEIFAYEKQAQDIVSKAQEDVAEMITHARATGERELNETQLISRKNREQQIEIAQKDSDDKILLLQKSLEEKYNADKLVRSKAKEVANQMVGIILETDLGAK